MKCPKCQSTKCGTVGLFTYCLDEVCSHIAPITDFFDGSDEDELSMVGTMIQGMASIKDKLAYSPLYSHVRREQILPAKLHHQSPVSQMAGLPDELVKILESIASISTDIIDESVPNESHYDATTSTDKSVVLDRSNPMAMAAMCIKNATAKRMNDMLLESECPEDGIPMFSACNGINQRVWSNTLHTAYSELYGMPTIKAKFHCVSSEIKSFSWDFDTTTTIWQPVDWAAIGLKNNEIISYMASAICGGINYTYYVTEMLDGGFKGGVSLRSIFEEKGEIKKTTARTPEEAVERLNAHFEKIKSEQEEAEEHLANMAFTANHAWKYNGDYSHTIWDSLASITTQSRCFTSDVASQILSLAE